jgi:hypothetical protein
VCLAGRQVKDVESITLNSDFLQQLAGILNPFASPYVPLLMVTVANWTGDDIYTVGPFLECFQNVLYVHLACAGQAEELDIGGIGQAQGAGSIRSHAPTVEASECGEFWLKTVVCMASHYCSPQLCWHPLA